MAERPAEDHPTLYYVEHDGMVYLLKRNGEFVFPTREEVPFEVEERVRIEFDDALVVFAVPYLDEWPRDWVFKDTIPALRNVHPLVQRAVNASLVREVSGGLVRTRDGDGREAMLMVKAARGFTKGMWNIPGGFLTYGETPEESVVREVKEETGLDIRVLSLVGVYTARFKSPYFMRGHMFLCEPLHRDLDLNPDEIAEARWMGLDEAYEATRNPFARSMLDAYRGPRKER